MVILPTEPIYSKLLVTALKDDFFSIKDDIAAIVSLLSVENILYQPRDQEKEVLKRRKRFVIKHSDHLTLLGIYYAFREVLTKSKREAAAFAKEHFLNDKSLLKSV